MSDKQSLQRKIQQCDFACFEAALFLDTHNNDKDALAYFFKHKNMLEAYTKEYEAKYGPLTIGGSDNTSVWEWADGPWPWEACSPSNAK